MAERRDPSYKLEKMLEAERKAWVQAEKAERSGECAEWLTKLRQNAWELGDTVKALRREAYENSSMRDGKMPYAWEYGPHSDRDR